MGWPPFVSDQRNLTVSPLSLTLIFDSDNAGGSASLKVARTALGRVRISAGSRKWV